MLCLLYGSESGHDLDHVKRSWFIPQKWYSVVNLHLFVFQSSSREQQENDFVVENDIFFSFIAENY